MTLTNPKLWVLSYNCIRGLSPKDEARLRSLAYIIDNACKKPKSRDIVTLEDPGILTAVLLLSLGIPGIVFGGKVDSGTLELYACLAIHCEPYMHNVHAVACPHELAEKKHFFRQIGIPRENIHSFIDREYRKGRQCNEWPKILKVTKKLLAP